MATLRLEGVAPRVVLEPVDLGIEAGGLVLIHGPSGSGKSLLLRAISDLDPNTGEAWLDDNARSAMPASRWRRRLGLLPAESFWWAERVGDHFPGGQAPVTLLSDLGFETDVLGWGVSRLSTGERQRLALVRMLALEPEAVLLDEATANLDTANRDRVEAVVGAYRVEHMAAVLWVSHDPEQRKRLAAAAGGRQFVIRGGRLEATD
jgi:ABC-type iron transport system FetAB ATPase subunit